MMSEYDGLMPGMRRERAPRPQSQQQPGDSYGSRRQSPQKNRAVREVDTSPADVPDTYVDDADRIMKQLMENGAFYRNFTTSKIRNILSLITELYNEVTLTAGDTLSPQQAERLQHIRVRLIYECGREQQVKNFVAATMLLKYIRGVDNDRQKFIRLARYMEALVAYHRFYGGE